MTSFCMFSVHFSRGFPEKGTAWGCVHYGCWKVSTGFPPHTAGKAAGLRHPCWTGIAAETAESNEKLDVPLETRFSSQPGLGPLSPLQRYSLALSGPTWSQSSGRASRVAPGGLPAPPTLPWVSRSGGVCGSQGLTHPLGSACH